MRIKNLLLISILTFGCTKYNSNDILLQIGQYRLTVADYKLQTSQNEGRFANTQFEMKLVDDGYFLAHAIEKRFDTIGIISKKLKYAIYDKLSKVDGYVWNRKVKPNLFIPPDLVLDAYNKRAVAYSLEILYFPTKTCLTGFLPIGSKIESNEEFYSLRKQIPLTGEAKFFQVRDYFPFYPLGAYTSDILSLQQGDVLGPIETLSGYYIVCIAGTESARQPAFEEEKQNIEKVLLQVLTEKYIWESQKEISGKAEMKINEETIREMAPKYNEEKKEWTGTDKSLELMTYKYHGSVHSYTVADLMEYIRFTPIIYGTLSDQSVIRGCVENFVISLYLFDEAKQLKIFDDNDFISFKKQFQESLILEYYNKQYLTPEETISPTAIRKYHAEHASDFRNFESATISVFKFKNRSFAFDGRQKISHQYKITASSGFKLSGLAGLISIKEMVVYLSDTSFNVTLINTISGMQNGEVSMPFDINGECWVIYLSGKSGNSHEPFKYAGAKVQSLLLAQKKQEARDRLLAKLKTKYTVKVNHLKNYYRKIRAR